MAESPTGIETAVAVVGAAAAAAASAAAAAAPYVAIGSVVAGTALSAVSASRQGRMQGQTAVLNSQLQANEQTQAAQIKENQALLAEREAQAADYAAMSERQAGAFDVARQREQGSAFLAGQRADIGGSGLEATGSPLLVMAESAKQLELDQLATTYASETRARDLEEQGRMARYGGTLDTYQAQQIRKGIPLGLEIGRYQARSARYGADLSAASSLISGGGRLAASYYGMRR